MEVVMSDQSKPNQQQLNAIEKGFLHISIASQFLELVYADLCREDSIVRAMGNEKRTGLMDGISCLMEDAQELISNAAHGEANHG
jgi:hypothetical protein